ncbi:hypothetical protein BJF84_14810 [Rhodococcus sp. CUA-806]|nr:hypothetical protein BJF84_14810 [Rhodococcus sp. CUA-806]
MSVVLTEIPDFGPDGDLPRGRFCVSMDDVNATLVKGPTFLGSGTRGEVWDDFEKLVALIKRKGVRIPAAFLGGSFVTSKVNPSDVDASILIDASRITNPSTYDAVVKIAANSKNVGLQVDAFVIPWHPDGTQRGGDATYCGLRGSWDDFWQRKVAKPDRDPPQRVHAMPVRGYLEVLIDGYV